MSRKKVRSRTKARKGLKRSESFEHALLSLEAHERPARYPGFCAETRRAASNAQFLTFAEKYWPDWRHTKIRLYRRMMEQRDAIAEAEGPRLRQAALDPASVVYQELTNGLLASAASEFCQYAEDLAVLCRACHSDDHFARDLVSGKAGKSQEAVKSWVGISEEDAAEMLLIPTFEGREEWELTDVGRGYLGGIERAAKLLRAVGAIYQSWEFHFMRYKHGLLLGLRYSREQPTDFIERRRAGLTGFPVAFDCGSVVEAIDGDGQGGLVIPDVGDRSQDVRLNAAHLAAERNLLREVYPPLTGAEPDIRIFEAAAARVSQLQLIVLSNRQQQIRPDPGRPYFLPDENPAALLAVYRESGDSMTPTAEGLAEANTPATATRQKEEQP